MGFALLPLRGSTGEEKFGGERPQLKEDISFGVGLQQKAYVFLHSCQKNRTFVAYTSYLSA
jgi:hypothetical protein